MLLQVTFQGKGHLNFFKNIFLHFVFPLFSLYLCTNPQWEGLRCVEKTQMRYKKNVHSFQAKIFTVAIKIKALAHPI